MLYTFDDILIAPKFSTIKSRSEVNLGGTHKNKIGWDLPLITANMDTVTGAEMVKAATAAGALACLHRFWSVVDNVVAYQSARQAWVSVGVGEAELVRAHLLYAAGARQMIIDVAHGAQVQVADQYRRIKAHCPDVFLVVGNFGNYRSFTDFQDYVGVEVDGVKIGIGPGAACTTRIKTGVGVPQFSAIFDFKDRGYKGLLIGDGGCKTPGDIAKALTAGADLVMVGSMVSGTDESPGEILYKEHGAKAYKRYRGSASKEAYADQGKDWACAEGESFVIPYKGSVNSVFADIAGGLASCFSYVGARNIKEFKERAEWVKVSAATVRENGAHGKG